MVDSTSAVLLAELDRKRKRWRAMPLTIIASLLLLGAVASMDPSPIVLSIVAVPLVAASIAAYYWDLLKKSVVMMYDLDDDATAIYRALHDAVGALGRTAATWHISARGDVRDPKYHAGAGHLVRRKGITINQHNPPFVRTNIAIYRVPTASGNLYFCPDTILYYADHGVGAVSYDDLRLECRSTRFIEEGSVPRDAKIVDRTWRYVNKKGGPDRRFKDNRELPICEYEEVHLRSDSGLNELLQVSRTGLGDDVGRAVQRMTEVLACARRAPANLPSNPPPPPKPRLQLADSPPARSPRPIATPPQAVGSVSFQDSALTMADVHEALFRVLCCVMVADGRASSVEKARIVELMRKSGASWDAQSIAEKVSEFIEEVQVVGFKATLATSLARVPIFRAVGRPDILLKCINSLSAVDHVATDAERNVVELIRQKLQ